MTKKITSIATEADQPVIDLSKLTYSASLLKLKVRLLDIRSKFLVPAIIALLLTVSFTSIAQPKHHKVAKKVLQEISVYSGQVTSWVNNEDFIYNGFYMQTSTDRLLVPFAPSLGMQMTDAIRIGAMISVSGVLKTSPRGEKEIKYVKIVTDKETIYDSMPSIKRMTISKQIVNNSGKIKEFQKDKNGKVNGYILDNNTILRVSAPIAKQIDKLVTEGTIVAYTGTQKLVTKGEYVTKDYMIVYCKTITIDGKQYLTK